MSTRINAGCYLFAREALATIPAHEVASVDRDTFPALMSSGAPVLGTTGVPQLWCRLVAWNDGLTCGYACLAGDMACH